MTTSQQFRRVYAKWRAQFPHYIYKQERIAQMIRECEREKLDRLHRHLTRWCNQHFTINKRTAA